MTRSNRISAERVQIRRERSQATVQAKMTENAQAGLGLASIILGAALLWYAIADWETLQPAFRIFVAASSAGLIWFGALSVIRFSIDEVRDVYQYYRMQELLVDKEVRLQQALADSAEMRKELRRFQSMVKTQEFSKASVNAREVVTPNKFEGLQRNVDEILTRWSQDVSYTRKATEMSDGDWLEAMGLLDSAGLIVRGGPGRRQRVIDAESLAQAQKKADACLRTRERFDGTNFTPA